MGMTDEELDDVIRNLTLARELATRAKRIRAELLSDGVGSLHACRSTALVAVRTIARHFPPARRPARV